MSNSNDKKTYMLSIKRNNNDYIPLEWQYTKNYEKEDLTTLEGIDHFTSLSYEDELLDYALDANLLGPYDKCSGISIIYNEKGKYRELKEGVVYYNEEYCLCFPYLVSFLKDMVSNKGLINNIANILGSFRNPSQELIQFVFILRNIAIFEAKGPHGIEAALSKFYDIPYDEKRKAALIIDRKYGPIVSKEEEMYKSLDAA